MRKTIGIVVWLAAVMSVGCDSSAPLNTCPTSAPMRICVLASTQVDVDALKTSMFCSLAGGGSSGGASWALDQKDDVECESFLVPAMHQFCALHGTGAPLVMSRLVFGTSGNYTRDDTGFGNCQ